MFYRCCQIESCMSNLLHVHPKYFITQLEKSLSHGHLGKNMEPSVMNIVHLVQLVTLGKVFAITTNDTAYLFRMSFKKHLMQINIQDSPFLHFLLTYSKTNFFVCSRSVVGPSPSNPIDPAATPCDIKTVTFLHLMCLYVVTFVFKLTLSTVFNGSYNIYI